MKKIFIITIAFAYSFSYAVCTQVPIGIDVSNAIEAKNISKTESLLLKYKQEVAAYLKKCDAKKDNYEETSITIHTYEAKLLDLKYASKKEPNTTDCSKVPNHEKLSIAFKSNIDTDIQTLYAQYKKDAKNYMAHCATHTEYGLAYESYMTCDQAYSEWE